MILALPCRWCPASSVPGGSAPFCGCSRPVWYSPCPCVGLSSFACPLPDSRCLLYESYRRSFRANSLAIARASRANRGMPPQSFLAVFPHHRFPRADLLVLVRRAPLFPLVSAWVSAPLGASPPRCLLPDSHRRSFRANSPAIARVPRAYRGVSPQPPSAVFLPSSFSPCRSSCPCSPRPPLLSLPRLLCTVFPPTPRCFLPSYSTVRYRSLGSSSPFLVLLPVLLSARPTERSIPFLMTSFALPCAFACAAFRPPYSTIRVLPTSGPAAPPAGAASWFHSPWACRSTSGCRQLVPVALVLPLHAVLLSQVRCTPASLVRYWIPRGRANTALDGPVPCSSSRPLPRCGCARSCASCCSAGPHHPHAGSVLEPCYFSSDCPIPRPDTVP